MTVLLALCMIGNAVFSKLPADNQPTLRQAIVAAGETPGSHLSNLDTKIAGWSYECDGDNYAAAYFVPNAGPADFGKLWIARYDAGKKAWTQASSMPPGSDSGQAMSQEVIALFYDGYYLYIQLQSARGEASTLQFNTALTYKREFFGKTWAGLSDYSLFYEPNSDVLSGDPLGAIFDPVSGKSRAIFPPEKPTSTIVRGDQLTAQQYAACGQQWFDAHGLDVDKAHPFRRLGPVLSNVMTDSLAFAVVYGAAPDYVCAKGQREPIGAIYVFVHPSDTKRMKFVEQPLDLKHMDTLDLRTFLTKEALLKLFGAS